MDAKEEGEATTPPPSSAAASQSSPLSRQITIYSYPKARKRKSRGSKTNLTQIHKESPEPNSGTELGLCDKFSKPTSCKQKRGVVNDFYDSSESKSSAMERAEEIQESLEASFPSFAKALVRSNVTVGFWMHLPMRFCKLHLPKHDTTVFLETENGEEYIINYISERTALSGGWKAFCSAHKLHEGDVLVFHLVKPLRFKVYIVRGTVSAKTNGKLDIQKVDAPEKQITSDRDEKDIQGHKKGKHMELPSTDLQDNNQENSLMVLNEEPGATKSENDTEDHCLKTLEVVTSSGTAADFKDVESIESFSILINGLAIECELSDHQRTKYYELCCSQRSFLHDNLLKSINYKLAAEIIIETVNVSEAIRASNLTSSHADFAVWDKTLKGFELLGMNVGFLRSRLSRLMSLAAESEAAVESECREFRVEQARLDAEMRSLESKLMELKEQRERLDAEIEALKVNAEMHELMFQEAVNAPW
ncbi:B3 domain-containing protein Os01g0234100 isoform X2 [Hevea brasiliensis]|uniref:B3 domain-containing protein Os01g0234100 isoform X2 n=1 Tax=Hevea brasiliensis TaxID=3981 RepID=UPI0025FDE820|nr:B3 domain-containing protein Os01g0234100 isoform X2 [Hevea brasiliensis]